MQTSEKKLGDRDKVERVRDGTSSLLDATLTDPRSATWWLPWRRVGMKPLDANRSWFTQWLKPLDEPKPDPDPGQTTDWLDVLRGLVVR